MTKLVGPTDKIPFPRKTEKKFLKYNYISLKIKKENYTFYYLTNVPP